MADRNLTDADIDAVIDRLERRFYLHLGKGVWSIVWKVIVLALLAIAAYGAHRG